MPRLISSVATPRTSSRAWPTDAAGVPVVGRPFGQILADVGAANDKYLVSIDFTAPRPLMQMRFGFANWYSNPLLSGGPEFPNGGVQLTIRGQLDVYDGSQWRAQRITFNGAHTGTVNSGGLTWGEYHGAIGGGSQCRLTLWVDPGTDGKVPVSLAVSANDPGVGHQRGASIIEPTWGDPLSAQPQVNESTFVPVACLAQPLYGTTVVGLLGDSITMGIGDIPNGWGFLVRACDSLGLPWQSVAIGGDFLPSATLQPQAMRRLGLAANCDWVIEGWGTNNIGLLANLGGTDPSAIMNDKVGVWRQLAKMGFGVCSWTQTPCENSDPTIQERLNSLRNTLAAWQRDGAPWNVNTGQAVPAGTQGSNISRCLVLNPDGSVLNAPSGPQHPLAAMFDVAKTVENPSQNDGNKWAAGMGDGSVHPVTAGHIAMASAIRPEVLNRTPPVYRGA